MIDKINKKREAKEGLTIPKEVAEALPVACQRCEKCAFRPGSPERSDPYEWLKMADNFVNEGAVFICHEGVPGHSQQKEGEPLQLCAGWHSMKGKSIQEWAKLAHSDNREPDPKFLD